MEGFFISDKNWSSFGELPVMLPENCFFLVLIALLRFEMAAVSFEGTSSDELNSIFFATPAFKTSSFAFSSAGLDFGPNLR